MNDDPLAEVNPGQIPLATLHAYVNGPVPVEPGSAPMLIDCPASIVIGEEGDTTIDGAGRIVIVVAFEADDGINAESVTMASTV